MSHDTTPQEPPVPLVSDEQVMAATTLPSNADYVDMVTLRKEVFAIRQRYETERKYLFAEVSRLTARVDALEMDKAELQAIGWELEAELAECRRTSSSAGSGKGVSE